MREKTEIREDVTAEYLYKRMHPENYMQVIKRQQEEKQRFASKLKQKLNRKMEVIMSAVEKWLNII